MSILMVVLGACRISLAFGQPETEVYLVDLEIASETISLTTPLNISNNPGYDNQPSFLEDGSLLYSRTRDGQTDIARYHPASGTTSWLSHTPGGSEYSPLKIPGREAVSAIRLDTTGLQRLYAYPLQGGDPTLLVEGLKIGYHVWVNADLLVCSVLVEDRMDLVVVNFKDHSRHTFQKDVGRSLQQVPGSGQISYTSIEDGKTVLKSMDPRSGANTVIAVLPNEVQDVCWLTEELVICGSRNKLLGYNKHQNAAWAIQHALEDPKISISRLSYDNLNGKLAMAVETVN
ncbi:MAG: hypothetical protein R3252_01135 [Robiginitalea sp.]|nr:hypothetical protein [Robiginitalea sp.]